ncbi:hypothetical protein [Flagellimonas meridianipacifica]|uniref:Quinol monooxygenase YgiN n=1 Tax=Flagellimonas meridianipacifica TaxID=1080225 RepID=A0A2T0MAZ1_9FLAO|nr:hypothetical protein [Allomuricauda pacifica]PRX54572.1 hypothetical protein CLV81_2974 [Allomuricauda pacifica]
MNSNRVKLLFICILCGSFFSFGQDNLVTLNLKKGEVFDILFLTTREGSQEIFKEYRQTAFPVASEMGFSPLPGFKIRETVQGNYEPTSLILAKWTSLASREKFLDEIEERVPNFHDMRKKIWSIFNLTYYELSDDYSIQLDREKVIVATACFKKENTQADFTEFLTQWKKAVKKTNGTLKMELVNGKSPKGYVYNPDYMVITQWETKEDFNAFQKENLKMDADFLKNVNQFALSD